MQRRYISNPIGHCKIPIVPCAIEIYYRFLVTSPFEKYGVPVHIMAPCLPAVKQNQASFLKSEFFACLCSLCFKGRLSSYLGSCQLCEADLSWNSPEFRQQNEWKTCCNWCQLWSMKARSTIIFKGVKSPALIRILSSCDTVVRLIFLFSEKHELWVSVSKFCIKYSQITRVFYDSIIHGFGCFIC